MQQESPNKLYSFHSHLLELSGGGVVFEGEGDLAIVNSQDAMVGNGDAMSIAAQITEDRFGGGEGRFGVDDPVLLIEWVEELAPNTELTQFGSAACQLELAGIVSLAEGGQELAAKQTTKDFGRQQESLSGCDPGLAIWGESATGDYAV